jgi:hypothetical protein
MATAAHHTIPTLVLMLAVFFPTSVRAQQVLCLDEADDIAALQIFEHTLNTYVELHRSVELPLPARDISSDPEATAAAAATLAAAIREARPDAGRGEIFRPEVADLFRLRLADSEAAHDYARNELAADDEGAPAVRLRVNHAVPWIVSRPAWPTLVRALPTLPLEVEYRIVNRDLVLVDVAANIIVDVLDEALPAR